MNKSYYPVVCTIIRDRKPSTILDVPSGIGWLREQVREAGVAIDGIDLYAPKPPGYREFLQRDLEEGVPDELGRYDMIVSCEGIEHIANPGLFLKSARRHLNPGGTLVITTPNTWHPAARLTYFLRGFFPGFPSLAGRIATGTHMHIMPWSWPQLYLHLSLAGFGAVELHPCNDRRTRLYERMLAPPMLHYCSHHARKAHTESEREYWRIAGQPGSLYSRQLVVSARNLGGQ